MLEITRDHIQKLNDTDLRALIGYLCEAEVSSKGLPTSCVTWGGKQTAADGGLDVRVDISKKRVDNGYMPKPKTGFQVKKHDLLPSAIQGEMSPKGELRSCIIELAKHNGAYIIVSGKADLSDSVLKNRKKAMDSAVRLKLPKHNLVLDFYDSERIAAWVRNYPSLLIWVRNKTGEAICGWKAYENWANPLGNIEESYLVDDKVRINHKGTPEVNIIDGLNHMRKILCTPKTSVRLAGLSGVGKTRFAQALFDNRLGLDALNPQLIIYTDIGWEPSPTPYAFAEQLIAIKRPVILIIDNCPPAMHQELIKICKHPDSCISLLTIEYDITDEQTNETEAFYLEPASDELIAKLVHLQFPHIDTTGAQIVSDFSGGNARIAVALARTVQAGESLLSLNDNVLFDRLFWQREDKNENLRKVAEVCALVYSFNSDVNDNPEDEIEILASLIQMDSADFYRYISILLDRDMMQQRNKWRAILPHAIANKLASQALKNIPSNRIINAFTGDTRQRLMLSFAHRLSYLHYSKEARTIAENWISATGILANICDLDDVGRKMLAYVAATVPELTLKKYQAIDSSNLKELLKDTYLENHMRIIANLAYDKATFTICMDLLVKCVLYKREKNTRYSNHSILISFFHLYYSGTNAEPTQKLSYIKILVFSKQTGKVKIGLEMLEAALSTSYHPYTHDFSFGSHNRNGGYKPQNNDDYIAWYQSFIDFSVELILRDDEVGHSIQKILSSKARELCRSGLHLEISKASKQIRAKIFWPSGFVAVHEVLKFDKKRINDSIAMELKTTKAILAPVTDEEKAVLLVSTHYGDYRLLTGKRASIEHAPIIAEELGRKIVSQPNSLLRVLYESVRNVSWLVFYIGRGIAKGSENHRDTWKSMISVYRDASQIQKNYSILCGFIQALHEINVPICNAILDEAVNDFSLKNAYIKLQSSFEIDEEGISRIKRALSSDLHDSWSYNDISYNKCFASLDSEVLEDILILVTRKPEGDRAAVEIFAHLFYEDLKKGHLSHEHRKLGRKLLILFDFSVEPVYNTPSEYHLLEVFNGCFMNDNESKNDINSLIANIYQATIRNNRAVRTCEEFLQELIKKAPLEFLNVFLSDDIKIEWYYCDLIGGRYSGVSLLNNIDSQIIIDWCKINPEMRYIRIAQLITPYENADDKYSWTVLAKQILSLVSNPISILNIFYDLLWPSSWSGSRALIMESRVKLIEELRVSDNEDICEWATKKMPEMQTQIDEDRIWEESRNRIEERFE